MTEISDRDDVPLAVQRFVLQWGDLGGQWGVNRSVAQIHALLFLSERPLTAEEIADSLRLARSNVSNSIKELLAWDLIRRVPVMGDRRDHFEAETDVWEIVLRIAEGRKKREIDPAARALRSSLAEAEAADGLSPVITARLREMLDFVETADRWYDQMLAVPKPKLTALVRMGSRVVDLVAGLGRVARGAGRDRT